MHIEFRRIILHNFMSFGDADLQFNNDGFVRVSGVNENPLDNARSNGSGKSSLWEALVWAITGSTIRGTSQVSNIYGQDGCYVDIEFYIDKTRYQIIRSKDHKVRKTNIQILINGEDVSGKGIRDSEKLLKQYLPDLTASLLGSIIVLGQGLPQRFTNNSPSGRKEVLEQLSKSDFMIDDLKQRVTQRKQTLTTELREYENTLLANTVKEQQLNRQILRSNDILSNLNADALVTQQTGLEDELRKLSIDIDSTQNDERTLAKSVEDTTTELMNLISDESVAIQNITNSNNMLINPVKQYCYELESEHSVLLRQLTNMRQVRDTCPTCGQKLPDVHKPDTTEVEQQIAIIKEKQLSETAKLKQLEESYKHDIENTQNRFRINKDELTERKNTLSRRLQDTKDLVNSLTTKYNNLNVQLNNVNIQLTQLQTIRESNIKIIEESSAELVKVSEQILYINNKKDLTQQHLDVISKFETALKRDFRGYLLSTVIEQIETRAKYYSKMIFDTDKVSFCLDGNNIDISYMSRAYENLSGGEKQKVDLIIQFSIRDMLSQQLGFTSNILILDEVFDGLDALGCNKVIDMIASLSDVKNVFIVTHRKDLSIPSDKELVVVKSSLGLSEIRG